MSVLLALSVYLSHATAHVAPPTRAIASLEGAGWLCAPPRPLATSTVQTVRVCKPR